MPEINENTLKNLLGDDPIATSISVRIRQDEQTLTNLERRFNSIKQEAEGIAKALKEAGVAAQNLGAIGGLGGKSVSTVGNTKVEGGPFTPTAPDKGRGVITRISGLGGGGATPPGGGGGPRGGPGGPGGPSGFGSAALSFASQLMSVALPAMDQRIDRGYQYSLAADRMTMLFQQMKGMSQQAIQDVYRQPLTQYKLGAGGINTLLGLEATTGMSAAQQARSVEALRVSSGFSVSTAGAASTLQQLASPQVANRMFMMTGMSIVKPGGGYRTLNEVMQNLVKNQGLTDPRILQSAMMPGSVTRANLTNIGVTGELQNQLIQYAQQNMAFKQRGGSGMYDPSNKGHQKIMGIENNFAMQAEETDRVRGAREEQFYSRQADNFAKMEKQTQSLTRALGALEDKLSGLFGIRTSTRTGANILGKLGQLAGAIGSIAMAPATGGMSLLAMPAMISAGNLVGQTAGSLIPQKGDAPGFKTADRAEREAQRKLSPSQAASVNSKRLTVTTSGMGARLPTYGPPAPRPSIWKNPLSNKTTGLDTFLTSGGVAYGNSVSADMAERRALNKTGTSANLSTPFTEAKMSENDIRYKNTPIYGPDGKLTNLYDLLRNPRVNGQFPGFTAGWMDLYADYYSQTKDVGTLNSANRTYAEQEAMWLDRMQPTGVTEKGNIPPGSRNDWYYQGQYWVKKRPSDADAAWPGAPWANHQHGLAVDLQVGNSQAWSEFNRKNADSYGIEWFGDVNNEPWHLQMAGTRVRGSGGGAGYAARQNFSAPDPYSPLTYGDLQGRRDAVNLFSIGRGLANSLNRRGTSEGPITADRAERRMLANKELINSLSTGAKTAPSGGTGRTLPSGAYVNGQPLSIEQRLILGYKVGFRGEALINFVAISERESAGVPTALNNKGELSYGLLQHNMMPGKTSDVQNRIDWGIPNNEALYDPETNFRIAFEKYNYNIAHGMNPYQGWVPPGGSSALEGASKFLPTVTAAAKKLGYIPQSGDGLPPERKPAYKPELRSTTNDMGTQSVGNIVRMPSNIQSATNHITVSPSITINASGSNIDQDFERMARKVASMLEQEVNRTMMRRT